MAVMQNQSNPMKKMKESSIRIRKLKSLTLSEWMVINCRQNMVVGYHAEQSAHKKIAGRGIVSMTG